MTVYKVALPDGKAKFKSVCARGKLACSYKLNEIAETPKAGQDRKCYLTVFKSLKDALRYQVEVDCSSVILRCEASRPAKGASDRCALGSLRAGSTPTGLIMVYAPDLNWLYGLWPPRTLQFKEVTPKEIVG